MIHGPWGFKKSGNRTKDPEVKKMQESIKEPIRAQEDQYPSSKLLMAVELCQKILDEDKDKPDKERRKFLVYCNWTNMRYIILKVRCVLVE